MVEPQPSAFETLMERIFADGNLGHFRFTARTMQRGFLSLRGGCCLSPTGRTVFHPNRNRSETGGTDCDCYERTAINTCRDVLRKRRTAIWAIATYDSVFCRFGHLKSRRRSTTPECISYPSEKSTDIISRDPRVRWVVLNSRTGVS